MLDALIDGMQLVLAAVFSEPVTVSPGILRQTNVRSVKTFDVGRQLKNSLESNAACPPRKILHQEAQDRKNQKGTLETQHLEHLTGKLFEQRTLRGPKNANTKQTDDLQQVQVLNLIAKSRRQCTKRLFVPVSNVDSEKVRDKRAQ
jgi:hypothetical protein